MTQNTTFGQNIHELFSCRHSSALLFAGERVSAFREGLKSVLLCIPLFSWTIAVVSHLYRNENRGVDTLFKQKFTEYLQFKRKKPTHTALRAWICTLARKLCGSALILRRSRCVHRMALCMVFSCRIWTMLSYCTGDLKICQGQPRYLYDMKNNP